jgi:hypothetical protein
VARGRKLCGYLEEIGLKTNHDQDIIGAKHEVISGTDEKWPTEDCHNTN